MRKKHKWWTLDTRSISNLIVVIIGILFFLGLSHFDIVWAAISKIVGVFTPFIAGFIIAFLLNAPVMFFERKLYHKVKLKRGLSVLTVYVIAFAVLVILLYAIIPSVADSVMELINNFKIYLANLNDFLQQTVDQLNLDGVEEVDDLLAMFLGSYEDVMEWFSDQVNQIMPQILNVGVAVGSGFISAITAIISSVYMLLAKDKLKPQTKKLLYAIVPKRRSDQVLDILRYAHKIFVGFINGKLIDSAIIGVLCFIFCMILNIPFAVLVSVIVGVTNIIPFFGPFIGAIPCLMILVIVDPFGALKFLILIIVLQQFDGNILGPKILGDSTGLSALWVLVSIVVGGGLFGFIGMLLGVPTFAVIYALVRGWTNNRLKEKGLDANGNPLCKEENAVPEERSDME